MQTNKAAERSQEPRKFIKTTKAHYIAFAFTPTRDSRFSKFMKTTRDYPNQQETLGSVNSSKQGHGTQLNM